MMMTGQSVVTGRWRGLSSLYFLPRFVFLGILVSCKWSAKAATESTSSSTNTPTPLDHLIKARCGPSGHAIWSYEGTLTDPITGKTLSLVHGLELVRELPHCPKSLQIRQESPESRTILSRKLFYYTPDGNSLLRSYKLRPNSPERKIPVDQAITIFDSAISFVPDTNTNSTTWHTHTEWSNGKTLWGSTVEPIRISDATSSTSTIEYSIFCRPGNKRKKSTSEAASIIAPPRAALIQFGPSTTENNQASARETYQYSFPHPKRKYGFFRRRLQLQQQQVDDEATCTLKYTRYGEGPVWAGSSRYCALELFAKRLDHMDQVTTATRRLTTPLFWSVHEPVETPQQALKAVQKFQQQDDKLAIHTSDDEIIGWQGRLLQGGLRVVKRLRDASTWSPSASSGNANI